MSSILVCIDFSQGTDRLLATASQLAREVKASLILFHAVELTPAYIPLGPAMDVVAPPMVELITTDSSLQEKKLAELAKLPLLSDILVDFSVVIGSPVEEILEKALTNEPRFIMVGSHGHGALHHLFSGSVVNGVLRQSQWPVVVVPVHPPTLS